MPSHNYLAILSVKVWLCLHRPIHFIVLMYVSKTHWNELLLGNLKRFETTFYTCKLTYNSNRTVKIL